jgi:hypothetical protein
MNKQEKQVKAILDDAAKKLDALGVKYFMGVVDRQPAAPDGGKAYSQANVTGEDMCIILDIALPTRQDAVNLGIWVGMILNNRGKKDSNI